jgi:16S rRNA (guanine1207-N2)-methyltransferase
MTDVLRAQDIAGPILFAGESADAVMPGFAGGLWRREDAPWPPEGAFGAAVLDLPRSREAYRMALHAIAAKLPQGAPFFVYGANAAGIKSAGKALAPLYEGAETVTARAHARVWRASRSASMDGLQGRLSDWRTRAALEIAGRTHEWVSYPGVFAHGRIDAGTSLLLSHLPDVAGARALDFGAGSGVIARALADRGAHVTMIESDALAREAARENVPEGKMLMAFPASRFSLIVSNPPIHKGGASDLGVLDALLAEAPRRLTRGGALLLVVQRTVPVPRLAAAHFPAVRLLAEEGGYRVWQLAAK